MTPSAMKEHVLILGVCILLCVYGIYSKTMDPLSAE
jgi:hypothetical protein